MNFKSIRIVLVSTSHPGNIGSTARALKTMGLERLYLVNPESFPDQRAEKMAAGAEDLLTRVTVVDNLDAALAGCELILATSARPRGISLPGLVPVDAAALICDQADDTEVAIVFGRENSGLTNEELLRCHYHIHIPSNPEYSSLNLSQAVQIVAYELRMKLLAPKAYVEHSKDKLASADEIEQFYAHFFQVMAEIEFFKPTKPTRRLQQRLRRLFTRARLEHMEISILRGILSQMQYTISRLNK